MLKNFQVLYFSSGRRPRIRTANRSLLYPVRNLIAITERSANLFWADAYALTGAKSDRSGGAGRKGGVGEMNSRPALAFAAAEFRASETGAPSIHYPENYQYYFSNFL